MSTPKIPPIDPDDLSHQADSERVARIWTRLEPEVSAMAGRRSMSQRGGALRDKLRRPRATTWLVAAAMGGVLGGGIWIGRSSVSGGAPTGGDIAITPSTDATLDVFASGSQTRTFALPNGGTLTLDPESTVEVAELSDATMVLRLLRGTASIDGTRVAGGSISIVAGEARITAPAGGSMAVRRNAKDVDVTAMGRSVEIDSPLGHQTIASGQRLHAVPTHTTTAHVVAPAPRSPMTPSDPFVSPMPAHSAFPSDALALARDPETTDPDVAPPVGPEVIPSDEKPDWLTKYQANKWRDALDALNESGGAAAAIDRARSPGELALLCDLMRQAKNGALSIKAAKRIVDEFPGDPSAPVFAITLANLYTQAGQTDLANEYLARASKSPLQEDVTCRQLREGSSSDPAIVTLAQQYVAKYSASTFPALCMETATSIVSEAAAEAKPADPPETTPSSTPSASASASSKPSASAAPSSSVKAPNAPGAAPPGASSSAKSPSAPPGDKPSDPPSGK